ncbi:unnamed protein product [Hyaloperonospora brassicae]|uniref:RxLR effector candidate protein n=1 Tax=Hyaloperonospora brassicae TaxID=162125 RepID=A0AAV0TWQ4_HYABA|nr:unnamed protein product [Hyaloperonospora brassicae]
MRAAYWVALVVAALATSVDVVEADAPVTASTGADPQQVKDQQTHADAEIVLKLEHEVQTLTQTLETLETGAVKEKQALEKVKIELKTARGELEAAHERVVAQEEHVTKLRETLATERARFTAELEAAQLKVADETDKVQQLEKTNALLKTQNKAMGQELGVAKTAELTMMALLSSYYDGARVLTEQTLEFAQDRLSKHADTLEQVQTKFDSVKKVTRDTTSKFYQENVAPTLNPILDPILADVHKVVHPQVEKYMPILQQHAVKAKKRALVYSRAALRHAKQARIKAIQMLAQYKHVAAYAQKVVDAVLIVLAVPLALFWTRLGFRLVWWLLTTTLWVLTCGLCCSSRKHSSTTKSECTKKTARVNASPSASVSSFPKKTVTNKTVATTQKRNKKSKN